MLTQVKHLQEELQRFNPDAYLEPSLDIQSFSPATQCNVVAADFKGREDYESQIVDLEDQIEKLNGVLLDIYHETLKEEPSLDDIAEWSQR